MRHILPVAISVVVAALLQVALAPHLAIGGAVPNFMLLVVIAAALVEGPRYGAVTGFSAGLLFDLLGTGPIGPMALVLCLVGFAAGSLEENMFAEGWRLPVTVVFLASLVTEIAYWIVLAVTGNAQAFGTTFLNVMLPSALYNGVLALLIFPWLARFLRRDQRMTTFQRIG
jgi:rod shape-determining protein MreD